MEEEKSFSAGEEFNPCEKRKNEGVIFRWSKSEDDGNGEQFEESDPNGSSMIYTYSQINGVKMIWMDELESDFADEIMEEVILPRVNLLFVTNQDSENGKIPGKWLEQMNPDLIILKKSLSKDMNYSRYIKIIQKSAGEITFNCFPDKIQIYVSHRRYRVDFLNDEGLSKKYKAHYLGTLNINEHEVVGDL